MAELKERELKILSALSQLEEPARPTEIGQLAGETPLNTGRALIELGKCDLAVQTDKEQNLWAVTDTGRDYLEEHNQPTVPQTPSRGFITGTAQKPQPEVTVPSQSDLFKSIGERLRVGVGRGGNCPLPS